MDGGTDMSKQGGLYGPCQDIEEKKMELEEAQEIIKKWRTGEAMLLHIPSVYHALIVLDDRITELETQRDELVEVCKKAAARQSQALGKMRKHNIILDNLNDKYQKTAFTFYSMLVQTTQEIKAVFEEQDIKQPVVDG